MRKRVQRPRCRGDGPFQVRGGTIEPAHPAAGRPGHAESREHFGFVDGMSQPWIDGVEESSRGRGGGKLDVSRWVGSRSPSASSSSARWTRPGTSFPCRARRSCSWAGRFSWCESSSRMSPGSADTPGRDDAKARSPRELIGRTTGWRCTRAAGHSAPRVRRLSRTEATQRAACPLGAHIRRCQPRDALGFAPLSLFAGASSVAACRTGGGRRRARPDRAGLYVRRVQCPHRRAVRVHPEAMDERRVALRPRQQSPIPVSAATGPRLQTPVRRPRRTS